MKTMITYEAAVNQLLGAAKQYKKGGVKIDAVRSTIEDILSEYKNKVEADTKEGK